MVARRGQYKSGADLESVRVLLLSIRIQSLGGWLADSVWARGLWQGTPETHSRIALDLEAD